MVTIRLKMITIYVLELADKNFYVGSTSRPFYQRVKEHIRGCGSKWTAKHPFKRVVEHYFVARCVSLQEENRKTIELMRKHGWRNVRGGDYTYSQDDAETVRWWLPEEFRSATSD